MPKVNRGTDKSEHLAFADFISPHHTQRKNKTHLGRWVLSCAIGTMVSLGVEKAVCYTG